MRIVTAPQVPGEPDLHRALLAKGVVAREGREPRCAECGRRPLIGETMYRFAGDEVCELCRPARPGPAAARRIVLHLEHGLSVRRLAA